MRARIWMVLGAAVFLAGCAAPPPPRYYSLAALVPDAAPPAVAAKPAYGLRLQVSEVPAQADRLQLVVRDPGADPAVQVLNQSLWSAPLRDQVQAVLSARVAAALRVPDLNRAPGLAAVPLRTMSVRVTRFDLVWGQDAVLEASWTDHLPAERTTRLCRAGLSVPAGASVASLVDGQRVAVQALARLMAGSAQGSGLPDGSKVLYSGCTW